MVYPRTENLGPLKFLFQILYLLNKKKKIQVYELFPSGFKIFLSNKEEILAFFFSFGHVSSNKVIFFFA